MKFFPSLAVLALVTFGLALSACHQSAEDTTRDLFTEKMEQDFGYVTVAAAAPTQANCVTPEFVRAGYAERWPAFKLSNLDPKAYLKAFNAQPPVTHIPPPDELILADSPQAPVVLLLAFRGGVFLREERAAARPAREGYENDAGVEHLT